MYAKMITNPIKSYSKTNFKAVRGHSLLYYSFPPKSDTRNFSLNNMCCGIRLSLINKGPRPKMSRMLELDVQNVADYVIDNPYDVEARFGLADYLEDSGQGAQAAILRNVTELGLWPSEERRSIIEPEMIDLLRTNDPYPLYRKFNLKDVSGGPDVLLEMASIPPGGFMMGSPESEPNRMEEEIYHPVQLTHGQYIGKYTVTQAQYRAVMGNNPSHFQGDNRPVETVSWEDSMTFCKKLTELYAPEGWEFTLPTEAWWEYSCRAGTTTPYHYGTELTPEMANIYKQGAESSETCDVGRYKPNAFGLYDMHGNVWEWCRDYYSKDAYKPGNRIQEP